MSEVELHKAVVQKLQQVAPISDDHAWQIADELIGGSLAGNIAMHKAAQDGVEKCPVCRESMKAYWHTLTPGLVKALGKFYGAVVAKGVNDVHVDEDMNGTQFELTKNERSNWTKLRYHALVVKVKDENGQHVQGHWLLSRRGKQFLTEGLEVPKRVKTFRNVVVDHDEQLVSLKDVYRSDRYFDDLRTIEATVATEQEHERAGRRLAQ